VTSKRNIWFTDVNCAPSIGGVLIGYVVGALNGGTLGIVGATAGSRVVILLLCDDVYGAEDGGALVAAGLAVFDCDAR
jgi:hypothetical protein